MANWFKKTKRNGLTITQSVKGTTWSKSVKGGSVRHTTTHYPNGKTVQTTTQRSPGGFVKIEKKVTNKQPRLPGKIKKPKVKALRTRKVRYGKTNISSTGILVLFMILIILSTLI